MCFLLGIIFVICSFPFIFSPCIGCSENSSDWVKFLYYAPFIAAFQFGWACSQISHLALVPKLSPDPLIRTELLAIRFVSITNLQISVVFVLVSSLTFFLPQTRIHNLFKCDHFSGNSRSSWI